MTPAERAEAARWISSRRIAGSSLADIPTSLRPSDAEEGYAASVSHVINHGVERGWVSGHFETNIETFLHADLALHIGEFFF